MERPVVLLQKVSMSEADERCSEARWVFARIEVFLWLVLLVLGAAGTLLLKNCGAAGSETVRESAQLFIQREWQMVFESQRGKVLLDATILSQPITDSGELEVLFKQQSEQGGFNGVFIADGERVVFEHVPLSTFSAISVNKLRELLDSETLCLALPESMCLSEESRRKTRAILEGLP